MIHQSEPCGRSLFFWLYTTMLTWRIHRFKPTAIYYHGTYLPNSDTELRYLGRLQKKYGFTLHIVEHDCRHLYARDTAYIAWYRTFIDIHHVHLILIGSQTEESYRACGIASQHTMLSHAFLAPSAPTQALLATYPPQFWHMRARKQPLILMNAFACIRHGATDLYGMQDAIDAVLALTHEGKPMSLCILLATVGDNIYLEQLFAKARMAQGAIFFIIGNYELWPLLPHADIFIRPTYSDGDSVSVREALWANIPVIASDVCMRPASVITYDPHDPVGLRTALRSR